MNKLFGSAMLVAVATALGGCPVYLTIPDSITLDLEGLDQVQIAGIVFVKGNIYDDISSSAEFPSLKNLNPGRSAKSLNTEEKSLQDISEGLLPYIDYISLNFEGGQSQAKGGVTPGSHTITINEIDVDGNWEGRIELPAGEYLVYANAKSQSGATLYNNSTRVTVERGAKEHLTIVFKVVLQFYFNWQVQDLPGLYANGGSATILVPAEGGDWRQYQAYYSGPCCSDQPVMGSELRFYSSLPVNFSGDGGIMFLQDVDGSYLQDVDGNYLATDLPENFDIYTAADGGIMFDYQESLHTGTLLVQTYFDHDWYIYGVETNEYYPSIQEAVSSSYVSKIELGVGNYDGFYVSEYDSSRVLSVAGQGPNLTMIEDPADSTNPWTIHVQEPWWHDSTAKGGPGRTLSLSNMLVQGVGVDENVISFEYPNGVLQLDNVWVHSAWGDCITVINDAWVEINHSVVSTWSKSGNGITILGASPIPSVIKNSIFYSVDAVLTSESPVDFRYNCVYDYNQLVSYLGSPDWDPDYASLISEDPMPLQFTFWQLDSSSPCIGAADDGGDIGLRYNTVVTEQ